MSKDVKQGLAIGVAVAALTSATGAQAFDYRTDMSEGYSPNVETVEADRKLREEKKDGVENETLCDMLQDTAYIIMNNRQNGVPMVTQYKVASGSSDILQKMVLAAYDQPKYSSASYQQSASQEFADEAYLLCIKAGLE
jgi:hypothetical protein